MILVQDVCNTEWHDVIVSYKQYYCNVYHLKTSYVYEEMFHKKPRSLGYINDGSDSQKCFRYLLYESQFKRKASTEYCRRPILGRTLLIMIRRTVVVLMSEMAKSITSQAKDRHFAGDGEVI